MKGLGLGDVARVLVMVESISRGWVGKEVWRRCTVFVEHGDRIAKIAIVGDPKWESRMLMFTGAGFRRARSSILPGTAWPRRTRGWMP